MLRLVTKLWGELMGRIRRSRWTGKCMLCIFNDFIKLPDDCTGDAICRFHFRESTCHHTLDGACAVNGDTRLRQKLAGDAWYQAPQFHVGSSADYICWMPGKSEPQVCETSCVSAPSWQQ
jgi:hypothetical protein